MQTDILGREIKVRDIVAYSSSNSVNVSTGVVTKIHPKTIQIDGTGAHHPKTLMVVTEQYGCSGKQAQADKMLRDQEPRVDDTKPVVKAPGSKWRYGIFVCFDTPDMITDISQCSVHIVKLASDTSSDNLKSYRKWVASVPQYIGYRNYFWAVNTNRFGGDVRMYQSSSYHHSHDLPLSVVKDLGLKDYINSSMSYTDFKEIVKGKLQFNGFDPMTAKQTYR